MQILEANQFVLQTLNAELTEGMKELYDEVEDCRKLLSYIYEVLSRIQAARCELLPFLTAAFSGLMTHDRLNPSK